IIEVLRQRSRPYLFLNSLAPMIAAVSIAVLDLLEKNPELRERLRANTRFFRERITALGFKVLPGEHPIVPIILGDAALATKMAERLLERGVYVIGFSFPVVPVGQARIRVQMSAGHTRQDLEFALKQFEEIKNQPGK
ncbi:MAG: aminotransferase class I/II-fold pyridoxal phosphate-dependent enzyme, partial [Hydrocarboniphaga effusa]|nr:aminotransferase class I/II-fold pyridoxal phosphate-dependent enzyme [Hydrocarboniphaga effusa]